MIVLDCNAAFAMVRGTQEGKALEALLLKGEGIAAPAFLKVELVNVLWKSVRAGMVDQCETDAAAAAATALVEKFFDDGELVAEALSEAVRLGHPVYDMLYFVLARRLGATLFTLDRKLQGLCAENGVNCVFMDSEF